MNIAALVLTNFTFISHLFQLDDVLRVYMIPFDNVQDQKDKESYARENVICWLLYTNVYQFTREIRNQVLFSFLCLPWMIS